jgi:pilus assembly protein FimV
LSLVPATGEGTGASNRPGVAGGTGSETVTGLQQKLQNDRGALVSLNQSNADLESRVRSLKDISDKSDKLLSMKDATIAELQRKLADVQSGKAGAAAASSVAAEASAGRALGTNPRRQRRMPTRRPPRSRPRKARRPRRHGTNVR